MYDLIDADHLARVEGLGDHGRDARRVDWLLRRFPGRGLSGPITSACRSGGTVTTVVCRGLTEGTWAVLLGAALQELNFLPVEVSARVDILQSRRLDEAVVGGVMNMLLLRRLLILRFLDGLEFLCNRDLRLLHFLFAEDFFLVNIEFDGLWVVPRRGRESQNFVREID